MPYRHREKFISIFFCLGVDLISLKIYKFGWCGLFGLVGWWLVGLWLVGWLVCFSRKKSLYIVSKFILLVIITIIIIITIVFLCDKVYIRS
jgi:hypothetical protein